MENVTDSTTTVATVPVVVTEVKKRVHIDDATFLKAYGESTSASDCGAKLGISTPTVYLRKKKLVDMGVKMPKYRHVGKSPKDIEALRALAASLGYEVGEIPVASTTEGDKTEDKTETKTEDKTAETKV